jgi:type IX secretion system PorP/SprF family membrane protein
MVQSFKKYILHFIFILFSSSNSFSQDIHFSQFFETPLLRNPALAGIFNGDFRMQGVYRTQWNSVTVPYQTASLNAEYKLPVGRSNDFLTLGGEVLYDKAGSVALTTTHLLPVLNYHKSLNDQRNMYLSIGFMGGLVQRRLDPSKITTNNQYSGTGYDPGLSNGENFSNYGYTYFDASTGLSFNTQIGNNIDNNIFLGAAYHHFNKSAKISFFGNDTIEMNPKWVFSAGVRMSVTDYSYITFHGDYSRQGPNTEIIGGVIYSHKLDDPSDPKYILHAGAFLRWKDALVPVVKLEYKPFSVALSYDVNVSPLKTASYGRGGMEMSISYQAFINRNSSRNDVLCPRF